MLAMLLLMVTTVPVAAQSSASPPVVASPSVTEITATGTVVARATFGLGFGRVPAVVPRGAAVSGATSPGPWLVKVVNVQLGDHVEAGQELATADTSFLVLQLGAAQAAADVAREKLAKTLAKPTDQDQGKADAILAQAKQRLAAAEDGLADTVKQGRVALESARDVLSIAERRLRYDVRSAQPTAIILADRGAVAAARGGVNNARATAAASESRAQQAVDAAKLSVDAAAIDHAVATAPSAPDAIAADRSALAAAELNLARARDALAGARIVSPVSGVVSMIALVPGSGAPSGDGIQIQEGPLGVIAQVAEADVAHVSPGRAAAVAFPALVGGSVAGTVEWIAPAPGSAPGAPVVTYPVSVVLTEVPAELRPGMTANVTIETQPDG